MLLDPLSALSVVASVVQFVDFANKIVSKGKHLYTSTDGVLQENADTETVTVRLQSLARRLKESLTQAGPISEDERSQQKRLQDICNECTGISKELLSHLGNLEVPKGTEHRRWKSFRQALKSVWTKSAIDEMARKLKSLRDELGTEVLVLLRQV
jgi:hypothetical protein